MFANKVSSLSLAAALTLMLLLPVRSVKAQTIPSDARTTCTVTSTDFASWFESGTPTLNGVVKPADSLNFKDQPNCSFYQWAEQMFLWITSPAPPTYCGGGSRVFDSSAFFDVSPPDSNTGQRTFIPHTCSPLGGLNRFLLVRDAKVGPHGLPVIIDKRGRMLDVEPAPLGPSGKPMILNEAGKAVEIESLRLKEGKAIFMDKTGTAIQRARPILRTRFNRTGTVQQFAVDRRFIFLDLFGNVIETEEGQANTGAVLMSQTNSLVYYVSIVNDVFAYFLTGVRGGQITPTANQF